MLFHVEKVKKRCIYLELPSPFSIWTLLKELESKIPFGRYRESWRMLMSVGEVVNGCLESGLPWLGWLKCSHPPVSELHQLCGSYSWEPSDSRTPGVTDDSSPRQPNLPLQNPCPTWSARSQPTHGPCSFSSPFSLRTAIPRNSGYLITSMPCMATPPLEDP